MNSSDDFGEIVSQLEWAAQHFRQHPPVLDGELPSRLVVALECAQAVIAQLAVLSRNGEATAAQITHNALA